MQNIFVAAVLSLIASVAIPQNLSTGDAAICEQPQAIEAYCRSLDGKLKSLPHRMFVAPTSDEEKWREVPGIRKGIMAHAFMLNGNPVVVAFGLPSESGDWMLDATYYYRSDGTLAKKHELLNTFHGNASVTKDTIYACAGRLLSKNTRHLDLKTKKEKAPDPEFIDEDSPDYKRVRDLPFVHLITPHAE